MAEKRALRYNTDMLIDKSTALHGEDPDLRNRLFFAARNLAIEALLLRLENRLLREGFPVRCEWNETSFGSPSIALQLPVRAPSNSEDDDSDNLWVVCSVRVAREKISAPDDLSACFYSLGGPVEHETWRGRQPAKLVAFQRLVQEWADTGVLAEEITKVNYPFDYDPRSSF